MPVPSAAHPPTISVWEGGEGRGRGREVWEGDKVVKWQQILSGIGNQVLSLSWAVNSTHTCVTFFFL